jgi:predicted metal-dependent hydrolase
MRECNFGQFVARATLFDSLVCSDSLPVMAWCSTAGNLNFNEELLTFDADVTDYVIVHELLHFFAPNHGKLWKSLMRAHLGKFEVSQEKLRRTAI